MATPTVSNRLKKTPAPKQCDVCFKPFVPSQDDERIRYCCKKCRGRATTRVARGQPISDAEFAIFNEEKVSLRKEMMLAKKRDLAAKEFVNLMLKMVDICQNFELDHKTVNEVVNRINDATNKPRPALRSVK